MKSEFINDEYTDDELNACQYERSIRMGTESRARVLFLPRESMKYRDANWM